MPDKTESDAEIGQRIAQLRQERALRQEDFLELLAAAGVQWTRSVLSRVASGLRPLRWSEGVGVAAALGVELSDLATGVDELTNLERLIVRYRAKRRESSEAMLNARIAVGSCETFVSVISVTVSLRRRPMSEFTIHSTARNFVLRLASAIHGQLFVGFSPYDYNDEDLRAAEDALSFDSPYLGWSESPPLKQVSNTEWRDEHLDDENDFYTRQFAEKFPNVTFTDFRGSTLVRVDGINFPQGNGR